METLTKSVVICGRLPAEVLTYCLDASNFPKIFPEPVTAVGKTDLSDMKIEQGREFHFRHWMLGFLPMRWHVRIAEVCADRYFVDEMICGPLKYFRHTHRVEIHRAGTLYTDTVQYAAYGGAMLTKSLVTPYLKRIFALRHRNMKRLLDAADEH